MRFISMFYAPLNKVCQQFLFDPFNYVLIIAEMTEEISIFFL